MIGTLGSGDHAAVDVFGAARVKALASIAIAVNIPAIHAFHLAAQEIGRAP